MIKDKFGAMNSGQLEVKAFKERIKWIDVLKGLGIIAVVWGHSGNPKAYLMFFFHMPLFFFISGYLYKRLDSDSWLKYTSKRARHLLVPYAFYLILVTTTLFGLSFLRHHTPPTINWKALLLGGSLLEGVYGTFWFVTCLFVVQIFYDLLQRTIRLQWARTLVLIGCFLAAYWESRFHQKIFLPWNMDVALFAVVFYALGNLFKSKKLLEKSKRIKGLLFISAGICLTLFFYAYFSDFIRFGLDLKHRQYYFLGTNIIIPMSFILLLSGVSTQFMKWGVIRKALSSLGKSSMAIMYLHLMANSLAGHLITITSLRFLIIGISLPWLWYQIVSKIPGLQFLACGFQSKRPQNITLPAIEKSRKINL